MPGILDSQNAFPSDERRSMGAYDSFAFALLVLVLVLIFKYYCSYTAEVIILLSILWGGTILILLPFAIELGDSNQGRPKQKKCQGLPLADLGNRPPTHSQHRLVLASTGNYYGRV